MKKRNIKISILAATLCAVLYIFYTTYEVIFNTNYFNVIYFQSKEPFHVLVIILKLEFFSSLALSLFLGAYSIWMIGKNENIIRYNDPNSLINLGGELIEAINKYTLLKIILAVSLTEILFIIGNLITNNMFKIFVGIIVSISLLFILGVAIFKTLLVIFKKDSVARCLEIVFSIFFGIINVVLIMFFLGLIKMLNSVFINIVFLIEISVFLAFLKIKANSKSNIVRKKDIGKKEIIALLTLAILKCTIFMYTPFPLAAHWDNIGHTRIVNLILLGEVRSIYGDINPYTNELPYPLALHYFVAFIALSSNINIIHLPIYSLSIIFPYMGAFSQFLIIITVYSIVFTISQCKRSSLLAAISSAYFSSIFMVPSPEYFFPQSLASFFLSSALLFLVCFFLNEHKKIFAISYFLAILFMFFSHLYTALFGVIMLILMDLFIKSQEAKTRIFSSIMKLLLIALFIATISIYYFRFNKIYLGGINLNFLDLKIVLTYTYLMTPSFLLLPQIIFLLYDEGQGSCLRSKIVKAIIYGNLFFLILTFTCYADALRLNTFSVILSAILLGILLGSVTINDRKSVKIPLLKVRSFRVSTKKVFETLLLSILMLTLMTGFTMSMFLKITSSYRREYVTNTHSVYSLDEYEIGRFLASKFKGEKRILVISDGATAATISAIGLVEGWTPSRDSLIVKKMREVLLELKDMPITAKQILEIICLTTDITRYDAVYFVYSPKTYFYIIYGDFHKLPAEKPKNMTEYEILLLNLSKSEGFFKVLEIGLSALFQIILR